MPPAARLPHVSTPEPTARTAAPRTAAQPVPDGPAASGFPASRNDAPDAATTTRAAALPVDGVFDVCHVGTVLRALLFVQALLVLGMLYVTHDLASLAERSALASGVTMPALLLWLAIACLLRRPLAPLGNLAQAAAASALGVVCASLGWLLMQWAGQGLVTLGPWLATALSGGFIGALMAVWLQLRNRSQLPADTTARLAELQSRIRPHFLFNTLNSTLGLVRRDPARAEALLEDLAELFRVALADGASVVTLGDEIELARRYLAIEQTRFGARLQVHWELDPGAAGARVPPLLLQPLVENAVRHGVEPSAEGGVIRISSRVRSGMAWVSITNTLPADGGGPSTAGHGMALQNVQDRLRLMHDVAARFETHADADAYRVQLALPL